MVPVQSGRGGETPFTLPPPPPAAAAARDEDDKALFRVDARDAGEPRGDPVHQRVQQRVHGVDAVGVQRCRRLSVAGELPDT